MRTPPEERQQEKWTVETELLAQLIEEVSVLAADMRRKKPREVPRPKHLRSNRTGGTADPHEATRKGIAVLASTRKAVR